MKLNALILEDDDSFRELMRIVLRKRGYRVSAFSHPDYCPPEVLHSLCSPRPVKRFDIILCDVNMPESIGFDFIELLKRNGCDVKYISLMSGGWGDEEVLRAWKLDCHILSKPFHLDDLNDWLDRCERQIQAGRGKRKAPANSFRAGEQRGNEAVYVK